MSTTIVMPQLGESVAEGVIGKWLKNEGDAIAKDEALVEVITDKVNAEIPSPVAGVVEKISQPEGATVAVGQEIAIIGDGRDERQLVPAGVTTAAVPAVTDGNGQQSAGPAPASAAVQAPTSRAAGRTERTRTSPLVRRLAEQHGINLAEVPGTGIGGRVSKHDILSFVEHRQQEQGAPTAASRQSPAAESIERPASSGVTALPTAARFPPQQPSAEADGAAEPDDDEERIPVSPLRRMIAERMTQSMYTIPHATTMAEVDMSSVVRYREGRKEEFRRQEDLPLSYVAFVIKATVEALKEFPLVNAEWAGEHIIRKRRININVAVDAPEGLVTPVIHDADQRSLAGLSRAIHDLALRARQKKLKIEDMQGGTFTVNNTGALGSISGVSIINYPQGGILAAAAIVKRPVVLEGDGQDVIAVRSMMNLSFSFDHRLLDGGYAAGFVRSVKGKLEAWPPEYPLY